ncbi:MAG TPA: peptidase U32 family protein [Saprospiraceae bacterium]|jgi:putative protease|nr:U32 family peptidase [Saprospiraceae bacterium]HMT53123.1 peptidase U32 family protein [Saprospiraceae bacterium]HMT70058.1 peptidase U32 family protein [Saprospiraceae bacterium]HRG40860.1 peptidase U32 family protein [Saprospiraceae bacterium]
MSITKKPLLLSPVGSFESLHAAIRGGADAIYFGVEQLNMRTKSIPTITIEDIAEVADICKQNAIKAYLTLNTVVYDYDMQLARKIITECKIQGIDAVIASDFAVFEMCKSIGMPLHISTQANVSNIESVAFFAQMADVVVLARELTLKQVSHITSEIKRRDLRGVSGDLMKIETFVHGALCMAVSGKCYLSLHEKNASANRGACVQNCRRPYQVTDLETGNELLIDNEYIMSPKDLCTIEFVDELMDAGIDVFKIEGRSKSAEYVFTTTKCYREAIDAIIDGSYTKEKIQTWLHELDKVYNRGFWEGYFMGRKLGEWTKNPGSIATEKKIYLAKATKYYPNINVAEFLLETGTIRTGEELMIIGRNTGSDKIILEELIVNGVKQSEANKGDKITFPFPKTLKSNDKLYKIITDNG